MEKKAWKTRHPQNGPKQQLPIDSNHNPSAAAAQNRWLPKNVGQIFKANTHTHTPRGPSQTVAKLELEHSVVDYAVVAASVVVGRALFLVMLNRAELHFLARRCPLTRQRRQTTPNAMC